ncbi:glycosyltransferase [Flavihumibacter petaseus]|uniref:Putative glycosyltransferase n=1 Tax=Flavihumibacter petaseus NBRC 106054 TaxID=1220578 RepID=A0A0E9MW27_9BACT|nr:glycosyltransferase family 2 protein [Flavihumibacter petaseus]GAO41330.1 putative glycosyltransferase [Flavihumibacter petaseus NBRC 106054]
MLTVIYFIGLIVFIYLFCSITYLLVVSIAGMMYKEVPPPETARLAKFAVLIPCFRDDQIIVHSAVEALKHNYPAELFDLIVIADSLQSATVQELRNLGVRVIEVQARMKSKSIHAALQRLSEDQYDMVMILDADNIMKDDCLKLVNQYYQAGHHALQCHRTAKNLQTNVAQLDAISEEINNHLFRLGQQALGFSAAPSGSGMAFETKLLKSIFTYRPILENPGEDREIDMQLLKRGIRMHFIPDAWVLDEKVSSHEVFEKQRVRWMEAQWYHVRRFLEPDMKGIPKNRQYVNKLVQNLLLPRSLYLVVFLAIVLLVSVHYLTGWSLFFPLPGWWLSLLLFFMLTLAIAIPSRFYSYQTVAALLSLPMLMISMMKALFRVKKGRKEFIHTPKTFTGVKPPPK